jgi:adenosine deaminase
LADPLVVDFGAYLGDTMLAVQEAFRFDLPTWRILAANAIEASFLRPARREELRRELAEVDGRFAI